MKELLKTTSNGSSLNLNDEHFACLFSGAMADLWLLHRTYIDQGLDKDEVYHSLVRHIDHYTTRYLNGDYNECNAALLKNQDWHEINDRNGFKSIYGAVNELYVMVNLQANDYTVLPITDKEQQTSGQLDFTVSKPNWKAPVTCQSKSVFGADPWGNFTRKTDTWVAWSKVKASRIYISDHTHTLWADTLLFRGMLEEYDYLQPDKSSSTSLLMLYNLLQIQFPSFDVQRFGYFETDL